MSASFVRTRAGLETAIAVALAVAAAGGAVLAGTSAAQGLTARQRERAGHADLTVAAAGILHEGLAGELQADPDFRAVFDGVAPLIALKGAVSADGRTPIANVDVYGVDDRFWTFQGESPVDLPQGSARLSPALQSALGARAGHTLHVLVEASKDAPLESIHGRRDQVGRDLVVQAAPPSAGPTVAGFSLSAGRGEPYAIFVPLGLIQDDAGWAHHVNTLLVSATPGGPAPLVPLEALVRRHLTLDDAGLAVRTDDAQAAVWLESPTGLIDDRRAAIVTRAAIEAGGLPTPMLTAMVSSIRKGDRDVPYAVVTAIELQAVDPDVHAEELSRPPALLNEWTARSLGASVGDAIRIEFPTWVSPGRLAQDTAEFEVAGIVPVPAGAVGAARFPSRLPGITGAASPGQWRPRFPIDTARIRPDDVAYWTAHGATPQAFVTVQAARALWQSRAGAVSAIRVSPPEGGTAGDTAERLSAAVRRQLDPAALGVTVRDLRTSARTTPPAALAIGRVGLAGSLPLVASALVLAAIFFAAGRLTHADAARLAAAGGVLGVPLALGYAALLLRGVRGAWPEAVRVAEFSASAALPALAACAVTVLAAWAALYRVSRYWRRNQAVAVAAVVAVVAAALGGFGLLGTRGGAGRNALRPGTGGYALYVRTTLPFVHDPNGPEGLVRHLPNAGDGVHATPLRVRDGDDLGPGALYRPVQPRIVAVDRRFIEQGRFRFARSLERSDEERANPWLLLQREWRDPDDPAAGPGPPIVPVAANGSALTLLGRGLGDDVVMQPGGAPVRLRIVAVLDDSIIGDALVMAEAPFLTLFPEEEGYRALLVEGPADRARDVAAALDTQLRGIGGEVELSDERLSDLEDGSRRQARLMAVLAGLGFATALASLAAARRLPRYTL